jgi:transposase InsO family protein
MNKRFKKTTCANPKAIAAPNLLQQQFKAEQPNEKWVSDLTYVATAKGWLYVATVLDLFSRRIVGLAMNDRMTVIWSVRRCSKHLFIVTTCKLIASFR